MTSRRPTLGVVCVLLAVATVVPTGVAAQGDADAGVPAGDAGVPSEGADAGVPPSDAGAGADAGSERVGPSRTPPRLIEAPAITLPEGTEPLPPGSGVDLILTIAADGTVTHAEIGTGLREDIDALVLESAPAMRFEPATRDGQPVAARVHFRYALAVPEEATSESEGEGASESEGESESESATPSESEGATATVEEPELPDEEIASYSATGVVDRPEAGAATRMTFRGAELSTVPGTLGDPVRVLQLLPGVVRTPYGLPFMVVRGAGLQNTGYFIDGFPVPILWHFLGGPTVINPALITQQDFYPGNFPVRFGRFSGAVVSLQTGVADDAPTHIEIQVDALRAQALAIVPFDNHRGVATFAFRRSYFELILPLIQPGISFQYTDYQARLQYRFDRHFSASIFVLGSDDSLDNSSAIGGGTTSSGTNTNIGYQFQRVIARLEWRSDEGTTVRLSGSFGRDFTGFSNRQAGATPQVFQFENFIAALRLDASTPFTPWLRANYGIDASGTNFGLNITAPAPSGLGEYERPVFDPQLIALQTHVGLGTPGAYSELVLDMLPIELSIGARFDLLRYGNYFNVAPDPRIVGRIHFTRDLTFTAATGLFSQPPQVFQTVSTGGNPRLGPQRSLQSSVGFEMNLPLGILARVTGYFTFMQNIARMHQTFVDEQRVFFNDDQMGRSYGLEVLVRRPLADGFYGWLSYTLSRSERLNPGGQWFVFGFDQTHVLNLAASYEIDGWRFGLSFQLTTGRPTLSVCSATYNADTNDYAPTYCDRGERLPTYNQLNARIDRDFNLGNTILGSVFIEVLNVYNASNTEGLIYQYDYANTAPLPGLPILGTIGIRAYWEPAL